jgi:hypothetical protein
METDLLLREYYRGEAAPEPDLAASFEEFVHALEVRRDSGAYVAVVITGDEPGVGKSTLGIHLCRRLDPEFGLSHFAFRAFDLKPAVSRVGAERTEPFSMVQVDEPEGLIAKGGRKDEQIIEIASVLGTCRKSGIGVVLVAPQLWWYDALVRGGLVPYWLHVEKKGIARVHRKWRGVKYKTSQSRYEYDRSRRFPKIGFPSLARDPFFRAYVKVAISRNWDSYNRKQGFSTRGAAVRAEPSPTTPSLTVPERTESETRPSPLPPLRPLRLCRWGCGRAGADPNLTQHETWCPKRPAEVGGT